jgi:hypothetical protein
VFLPVRLAVARPDQPTRRNTVISYEEIMEILEAFDLTGSFRAAGELARCSHHTGEAYVARRDAGLLPSPSVPVLRVRLIDPFLPKLEEWVERSQGKIRGDVVFDKLEPLGFAGSGRTVRRALAQVKANYRAGETAGVSAVDHRAGNVGPVGLGSWPVGEWSTNPLVVCLAGVVPVPGGGPDLG